MTTKNRDGTKKKKNLLTMTFQTPEELALRKEFRDMCEKVYETKGSIKFAVLDSMKCRLAEMKRIEHNEQELAKERARFAEFSSQKWGGPTKSPKGRRAKVK